MSQPKFCIGQLKTALQALTPDQRSQPAQYWGENVGGLLLRPGAIGGIPITYEELLQELVGLPCIQSEAQATYLVPSYSFGSTILARPYDITAVEVLAEDYINPSGDGAEPASSYRPAEGQSFVEDHHMTEEELALECVQSAGTVMLVVEWPIASAG